MKEFLTRQIGPFPVYAYLGGLVALAVGVWYFKAHKRAASTATIAPQTNIPVDSTGGGTAPPLPLPYPSGTTSPVPPTPVFDTGASNAFQVNQSPWTPPAAARTTSQTFANGVVPNPSITERWRTGIPADLPAIAAVDPRGFEVSQSAPAAFPVSSSGGRF